MKNKDMYKGFDNIPSRRGRGGVYSYIRWQDVADRMNEVFGLNWSSEVLYQEIVGDNVITRVRVTIIDPENGNVSWQEGFGGSPNDKSSEAGNPFKSAYSKALKDACKKWGVGLFLDEDGEGEVVQHNIPEGYIGKELGVPPGIEMPDNKKEVNVEGVKINNETPIPTTPPVFDDDVVNNVDTPTSMSSTIVTGGMPIPPGVSMGNSLPKADQEIITKPDNKQSSNIPPVPNIPPQVNLKDEMPLSNKHGNINVGNPDYISDVQKAALNGLLSIKGVDYFALAREAFDANDLSGVEVPEIDKLTYQEAVHVVKYGNDKFRKR